MSKAAELAKWGEVSTNGQVSGRRNIVINGAMNVAQRSASVTGLGADANAYQTVDRFRFLTANTAGRYTVTQTADGPSGIANCTKIDVTTADTSIAAGEYFFFRQLFEGQDVQQLKKGTSDAEKITVSFYVKGNANATYLVELEDGDNSRLNSQTFNVTTSWTRVVKTFTADTTGALDDDNANSFNLGFWLHAGATYTGGTYASNTWASNTAANRVPSDNTSIFDSTDRTFFITGVQMEVGSVATPFEHRSFGEELQLCNRYFSSSYAYGTAAGSNVGTGTSTATPIGHMSRGGSHNPLGQYIQPTPMRASPTIVIYNPVTGTVNQLRADDANVAGAAVLNGNEKGTTFYINGVSSVNTAFIRIAATFDSEL